MITEDIKISNEIVASDRYADIRTGMYKGHLAAVKALKVADGDDFPKIREVGVDDIFSTAWNAVLTVLPQRFCREVVLWKSLSHPNVVKFIGTQGDINKGQFITVSEWMGHGTIMEYIRKNPVNRLEFVRGFSLRHFLH